MFVMRSICPIVRKQLALKRLDEGGLVEAIEELRGTRCFREDFINFTESRLYASTNL